MLFVFHDLYPVQNNFKLSIIHGEKKSILTYLIVKIKSMMKKILMIYFKHNIKRAEFNIDFYCKHFCKK